MRRCVGVVALKKALDARLSRLHEWSMQKIQIEGHTVLFDDADIGIVMSYQWMLQRDKHSKPLGVIMIGSHGGKLMHRHFLLPPPGMWVRHLDGNKLNNQRANLVVETPAEVMKHRRVGKNNTSGYKGVSWSEADGKWRAKYLGKYVGAYATPEAAYAAYLVAERQAAKTTESP